MSRWQVRLSRNAEKQYEKLQKSGRTRPSICDLVDFLIIELQTKGPERAEWPNYGKLAERQYHCHLKRGRPTYVTCWVVLDSTLQLCEREICCPTDTGVWIVRRCR